jgi:hypothetical protein
VSESVTIQLNLPAQPLWQNRRYHWRDKGKAAKAYRDEAFVATYNKLSGQKPRWRCARVDMMFYFPDRRNRDALNAAAAMKPAIDGVVDAGLIVDDKWANLKPGSIDAEFGSDRDCVLLYFTRLEDDGE